jgi:hypothetical protein
MRAVGGASFPSLSLLATPCFNLLSIPVNRKDSRESELSLYMEPPFNQNSCTEQRFSRQQGWTVEAQNWTHVANVVKHLHSKEKALYQGTKNHLDSPSVIRR